MKYWLHPKLKWKTFKAINNKFQGDLVPQHMDKILWEMLKDRQINMYLSDLNEDQDDPMIITIKEIPKNAKFIYDP